MNSPIYVIKDVIKLWVRKRVRNNKKKKQNRQQNQKKNEHFFLLQINKKKKLIFRAEHKIQSKSTGLLCCRHFYRKNADPIQLFFLYFCQITHFVLSIEEYKMFKNHKKYAQFN